MAARRSVHVCQACGHRTPKWLGRCPSCGAWDSFVEEIEATTPAGRRRSGRADAGAVRAAAAAIRPLGAVDGTVAKRLPSGLEALDRVLGGGVVAGGAMLLAGEPGIGKSTLLLQIGDRLATADRRVLYVSAEESPGQLRLRAERLGCALPKTDDDPGLRVVGETGLDPLLAAIEADAPDVLLVDSVQALRSAELSGPPGSIGQVRACADRLVTITKARGTALFLVGHITKDGAIAGPKSLEHLVDAVLTFEGERGAEYRVLRAQKNRFGATGEVALFAMRDTGLDAVRDPSRVLLARRRAHRPGSAVLASLHGQRPLLVEVQALVNPSALPSPRRTAVGLESSRAVLLVAVLTRFGGLQLADRDLFLNAVGGLTLREPGADLAVAAAILSAAADRPLPDDAVFFGEVGLLGEVRPVSRADARLREAAALGFTRAFLPAGAIQRAPDGIALHPVDDLVDLAAALVTGARPGRAPKR